MALRFLLIVAAITSMAATAEASQSFYLPSSAAFEELAKFLKHPTVDHRWTCSSDHGGFRRDDQSCQCVGFEGRHTSMVLFGVSRTAGALRIEQLQLVVDHEKLVVFFAEVRHADGDLVISFAQGLYGSTKYGDSSLRLGPTVIDAGPEELAITVEDLRWIDGGFPSAVARQCADESEAMALDSVGESRQLAVSENARFENDKWTVRDLRLGNRPTLALRSNGHLDEPVRGFLPPSLFAGPRGVRAVGTYHLGALPISLRAVADTEPSGGLGLALWSEPPICERGRCTPQALIADVLIGSDGAPRMHLAGRASLGSGRRHLSIETDEIMAADDWSSPVAADPLWRGAFLRHWRSAGAGLSLSNSSQDLLLGSSIFGPTDPEAAETGALPGSSWAELDHQLWLFYGTRFDLGAPGRADLWAEHRELSPGSFEDRYSALTLRVDRIFGSIRRIYLRPTLRGAAAFGISGSDDGSRAATRIIADAMVDGGIALRGRPPGIVHDLKLRGFAGRRTVIAEESPDAQSNEALRQLFGSPKSSYLMIGAGMDQTFAFGGQRRLEIPAEVSWYDDGRGRNWTPLLRVGAAYTGQVLGRRLVVAAHGSCRNWQCSTPDLEGRLQVDWTPRLRSTHLLATGRAHRPDGLGFEPQFRTAAVAVMDSAQLLHASTFRAFWVDWNAGLALFGDPRHPLDGGARVEVQRLWPQLGWGFTVEAAALPGSGKWAAMAGISRNSRAF